MLDLYRKEQGIFPDGYDSTIFVALSGHPSDPEGPGRNHRKSIVAFKYDFDKRRVATVPKPFLRYHGSGRQVIVGLAFGPDALYFVPLMPNEQNISAVYKVVYTPDDPDPFGLSFDKPQELMSQKGCFSCHREGEQESVAPSLVRDVLSKRLAERLNSESYLANVAALDKSADGASEKARAMRKEVLDTTGAERMRIWVENHLLDPQFDDLNARMPNMNLTKSEAATIAKFLLKKPKGHSISFRLLGEPRHRHTWVAFVVGFAIAGFFWKVFMRRR